MSRPLRLEFPGARWHVTARGNERKAISRDDDDRRAWLELLGAVVGDWGWVLHAYVLMPNHYHLLVETPEMTLSEGMRKLNGVYTKAFRSRAAGGGSSRLRTPLGALHRQATIRAVTETHRCKSPQSSSRAPAPAGAEGSLKIVTFRDLTPFIIRTARLAPCWGSAARRRADWTTKPSVARRPTPLSRGSSNAAWRRYNPMRDDEDPMHTPPRAPIPDAPQPARGIRKIVTIRDLTPNVDGYVTPSDVTPMTQ